MSRKYEHGSERYRFAVLLNHQVAAVGALDRRQRIGQDAIPPRDVYSNKWHQPAEDRPVPFPRLGYPRQIADKQHGAEDENGKSRPRYNKRPPGSIPCVANDWKDGQSRDERNS